MTAAPRWPSAPPQASPTSTLERLDVVLDDVQDALLAPLTPNERKTFVRLLAKLT